VKKTIYINKGGASIGAKGLGVYIKSENIIEEIIEIVEIIKASALLKVL